MKRAYAALLIILILLVGVSASYCYFKFAARNRQVQTSSGCSVGWCAQAEARYKS